MDLGKLQTLLSPLKPPVNPGSINLQRLFGDASSRTYYRVSVGSGPARRSWVLMQMPAGVASVSEEITNLKDPPRELPFLNIARTLRREGLPVPDLLGWDPESRLMLLEDCGDETIAKAIPSWSLKEKESWYRRAIDLLIRLQQCRPDPGCIAFQRSFDTRLLNWEFEHFLEYGIEARGGDKIPPEARKKIVKEMDRIAAALVQLPTTLVHRDFQSRNLMIQGNRLRLLDFQDALQGPLPYDLVALLRDSYVRLEPDLLWRLVDYYVETKNRLAGSRLDRTVFRGMFDWMTVQRKLKDAGRFVFIDRIKKNPSFLPFIPTSLAYVREAFERQPELHPLWNLLKKFVPEWASEKNG